ncbi:hypothetical protein I6A60_30245 [Frankia sp. AgB1.9]|uniref:hypothetical protein n=1 Tax=unclassified Frankia TaxID=2632575 RepID=UPI0019324468|nr:MULTISPECIES: hypothetical protein [unclassified Frankia]MBL7492170.1 hypothetical protein [Frankia sp. AgW1.1]MBL7552110.1 hypothetical protein [Frankia sp. AgB1.9]MBL7622171.1 hypothetical protein [Frankia sp. AgB1.8]
MSLSDRLHLRDEAESHETESPLQPTGEDAGAEPPFTYPARTAEHKPASQTADVDTDETPDSRVDEPEATALDDKALDDKALDDKALDDWALNDKGLGDEALDETPADENAAAKPFGEPVAVTPAAPFDEPVIVNSSDDEASAVPPADEPVAAAAPVDEAVVPSDTYGDEHVDPVDEAEPVDAEASTPPVGLGAATEDGRVDEPVADDFVADPPDGPAVAADASATGADAGTDTGTDAGTDGPEQPAAGAKEQPGDWRQVLMEFVDHPREAVEKADQLVEDAVRALTEQINREHTGLRDAWRTHGEPSTEDLRKALRGYRDFFEKVLSNR